MRGRPMSDLSPPGNQPWLTIIGIGEDGPEGLGEEAKRLIASAPAVFGGVTSLHFGRGKTPYVLLPLIPSKKQTSVRK